MSNSNSDKPSHAPVASSLAHCTPKSSSMIIIVDDSVKIGCQHAYGDTGHAIAIKAKGNVTLKGGRKTDDTAYTISKRIRVS